MILLFALACAADPRPDILLVTVDTLRADRLGFMGHAAARTPNLDALAARGRVFTQATTPIPRTTPALASLQTGLWPVHHGAREVGDPMTATATLASALSEAGWSTAGISAIRVAGPEQHLDRGFDAFQVRHDAPAADITALALEQIGGGPTFLWVHYADPHFPYLPDDPAGGACRTLGEQAEAGTLQRHTLFADRDGRASAMLADCQALYDGEVAAVDAAVGALVAGMAARGRDTLVVFSADHGENQGEDRLFYEHGPSLHDAALRVPLVVAGPGVVPGRDDGVARLEDVAPTILDLAGVAPGARDGTSLAPRLRGGASGGPTVALVESGSALHVGLHGYLVSGRARRWCLNDARFAWCQLPKQGAALYDHVADPDLTTPISNPEVAARLKAAAARWPPESARRLAARTDRFKLVASPALDGGYAWALYDLADPAELHDVAAAHPDVVAELRAAIEGWADRPLPRAAERSDAEIEALRSLGYVE